MRQGLSGDRGPRRRSRGWSPSSLRAQRSNPFHGSAERTLDCFVASLLAMTDINASRFSQRRPAIFAVGKARFLQIEIAFDPPPYLVGDLAVAQQHVDEFPLRRNQFPRQV